MVIGMYNTSPERKLAEKNKTNYLDSGITNVLVAGCFRHRVSKKSHPYPGSAAVDIRPEIAKQKMSKAEA